MGSTLVKGLAPHTQGAVSCRVVVDVAAAAAAAVILAVTLLPLL